MFNDPVCGLFIDDDSPYTSHFAGSDFAFCSDACKAAFDLAPARYASHEEAGSSLNASDLLLASIPFTWGEDR